MQPINITFNIFNIKSYFKKMVKNNTKKRKKFSIEKFSDDPLSKKDEIWITTR